MKTRLFALLSVISILFVGACVDVGDMSGINELINYGNSYADEGRIAGVNCEAVVINVGDVVKCAAVNAAGTQLTFEGIGLAIWSSSNTAIAGISIDGDVTGTGTGQAWVYAKGTYNSRDSVQFTVN